MRERVPVLITGVGGGGLGHEFVKALKLAGCYSTFGVDMVSSSFGLFDVDDAYMVPPASAPNYIETLLDICQRRNIRVLIPGSEPELRIISSNRRHFNDANILLLINAPDVIELAMDKSSTMSFLHKNGFTLPLSTVVRTVDEIPNDFILPAIIKPAVGGGGSNNTFIVQEMDELIFACQYLVRQGKVVLLQEYVGTPEDEYTVGVLHSLDGELIGSIALKRYILSGLSNRIKVTNRTGRSDLSPILAISSGISQGEIGDYPEVRRGCEEIARAIHSMGPLNIQCRYANGKLYPFEINPRLSGTTYIRALVGFNEPDILIRHHLLGEALPSEIRYRFGRVVRGLAERYIAKDNTKYLWQVSQNPRR